MSTGIEPELAVLSWKSFCSLWNSQTSLGITRTRKGTCPELVEGFHRYQLASLYISLHIAAVNCRF